MNNDWLKNLPKGWRLAFGELLKEDIEQILDKYNIPLSNLKIYISSTSNGQVHFTYFLYQYYEIAYPCYSELNKIFSIYEECSKHICMFCGKPDVQIINGVPLCENCFTKQEPQKPNLMAEYTTKEKRIYDCRKVNAKIRDRYIKRISKDAENNKQAIISNLQDLKKQLKEQYPLNSSVFELDFDILIEDLKIFFKNLC